MVRVENTDHHVRVLCAKSVVLLLKQSIFEVLDVLLSLTFVCDHLLFLHVLHLFILLSVIYSGLKSGPTDLLVLSKFKVDSLLCLSVVGDEHLPPFDVVESFVFVRRQVSFNNSRVPKLGMYWF